MQPIIRSLPDTDLYKFTGHFPRAAGCARNNQTPASLPSEMPHRNSHQNHLATAWTGPSIPRLDDRSAADQLVRDGRRAVGVDLAHPVAAILNRRALVAPIGAHWKCDPPSRGWQSSVGRS